MCLSKLLKGHDADWIVITAGWGLGVAVAVYSVGAFSGHLNPAVTIGMAAIGKFQRSLVPEYIIASNTLSQYINIARKLRIAATKHLLCGQVPVVQNMSHDDNVRFGKGS